MDHELMDKAMQNFDVCVLKYSTKMKNSLYGMINHAYKVGLEDGKLKAEKQLEASAIEAAFQQGYDKGIAEKPSEIMKKYDEGYRKGLESNCAALLMGQERGQKQLLDALKVIADNCPTAVIHNVKESTPEKIIEMAKHYIDDDAKADMIRVGDEVYWVGDDGKEYFDNAFIVTDIVDGEFISGITSKGGIHFHDDPARLHNWHKTGRHFDILGFMKGME